MYGITFVILAITRSHTHIYINVVQYCRCPYRLELMKYKQASINIISTWLYSRIQGRQGRHRIMIHYSWASIPHYPHTLLILTPHPYRENLPGMKTRVCAGHFKQKPQPLFPLYLSLHFFFFVMQTQDPYLNLQLLQYRHSCIQQTKTRPNISHSSYCSKETFLWELKISPRPTSISLGQSLTLYSTFACILQNFYM